jgi:hypothetical protein
MTRKLTQMMNRSQARGHLRQAASVMSRLDHPRMGYQSARLHAIGAELAAQLRLVGVL